jgi:hypothetical protein
MLLQQQAGARLRVAKRQRGRSAAADWRQHAAAVPGKIPVPLIRGTCADPHRGKLAGVPAALSGSGGGGGQVIAGRARDDTALSLLTELNCRCSEMHLLGLRSGSGPA